MLPRELLILIDTREKKPLSFPEHIEVQHPTDPTGSQVCRVFTESKELPAGDYALCGFEKARLIERKGGAREVILNCKTADLDRWTRSLDKLRAACALPLIFLEGSPNNLLTPANWCKEPHLALDILHRMADARRVPIEIIECGTILQRRYAGEWVLRRLINGAIAYQQGLCDVPIPTVAA